MNRITLCFIFIFFIFSFTNCTSKKSSITSSVRYAEENIEKLFIIIDIPKDEAYANDFAKYLDEELSNRNIPNQIYVKQKLDLTNERDLKEMMSGFAATHYLVISHKYYYSDQINKKIRYSVSLINYEKGNKVWEGSLNQHLGMIKNSNQAKNDAHLLINELNNNHLIQQR